MFRKSSADDINSFVKRLEADSQCVFILLKINELDSFYVVRLLFSGCYVISFQAVGLSILLERELVIP